MSSYLALKKALSVYQGAETMDRDELLAAAVELSAFGVFSNRHIEAITGLSRPAVAKVARKPSHSGGRFTPEAIEPTLDIIKARFRGETDTILITKAVDLGVSPSFLSKLTGVSKTTIYRLVGAR